MTTITVPEHAHVRVPRDHAWLKKAGKYAVTAAKGISKAFAPHRASVKRLSDIPLTVGGIGCIAAGVFLASTVAGFIVLGAALIVLNQMVGDE